MSPFGIVPFVVELASGRLPVSPPRSSILRQVSNRTGGRGSASTAATRRGPVLRRSLRFTAAVVLVLSLRAIIDSLLLNAVRFAQPHRLG